MDGVPAGELAAVSCPVAGARSVGTGSTLLPSSTAAVAADESRVMEATPHDYRQMAEFLTSHASLRLQVVDACIVALAERIDLREVTALNPARPSGGRAPAPATRDRLMLLSAEWPAV
jgi:hypothetical protein